MKKFILLIILSWSIKGSACGAVKSELNMPPRHEHAKLLQRLGTVSEIKDVVKYRIEYRTTYRGLTADGRVINACYVYTGQMFRQYWCTLRSGRYITVLRPPKEYFDMLANIYRAKNKLK